MRPRSDHGEERVVELLGQAKDGLRRFRDGWREQDK